MFAALVAALVCIAPVVHDGDTIRCSRARVRLWGMDAPETSDSPRCRYDSGWACDPAAMRWAIPARQRLQQLTRGGVTCDPVDVDRFGRTIARCTSAGVDVGAQLVKEGLARDYTRYCHGRYLREETRARREQRGMWSKALAANNVPHAPEALTNAERISPAIFGRSPHAHKPKRINYFTPQTPACGR